MDDPFDILRLSVSPDRQKSEKRNQRLVSSIMETKNHKRNTKTISNS